MSVQIEKVILHKLIRKNDTEIELQLRDSMLSNQQAVVNLIEDINRIYNNKSKAYGLFRSESLFEQSLKELRLGNQDFLHCSIK